jgi:hypothetical protein
MAEVQAATERGKILGMVYMGCDTKVAAQTVGWSEQRLADECQNNPEFATELAEREGLAELHHMRNVHKAAEDVRYWRASSWWLDKRTAERREGKTSFAYTVGEIQLFLEELVDLVFATVACETDRDRLVASLFAKASEQDRRNLVALVGEPVLLEVLAHAKD